MEAQVINTLAGSSNFVIMLLLASGPFFGAGVLFIAYKLTNKFGERFLNAISDIAEQTKLMREMVDNMRREIDDVKEITSDNNRRLEAIEKQYYAK